MAIICQKCKKEFKKRGIIKQGRYEGWCKCCGHNHAQKYGGHARNRQLSRARNRQRRLGIKTKKYLTSAQWVQILDEQNNKCAICRKRFTKTQATIDHITPLSKGGPIGIKILYLLR